ncbi:MAG: hypothetical protein ACYTEG_02585 [Planctomycetota bacterium]
MADKNKADSAAARAGHWLARLIGRRNLDRLADSARALKGEYEAGKEEAEDPTPKTIPHREVDSEE